ncbi:MAG: response regulator transcription factor [Lachnospirales bacterium]
MLKRVLIVEDERIISKNISDYLKNSGYETIVCDNGQSAIEIFKSEKIDMFILDLMLPKLSGEEVCMQVREQSNVPIIMLTAKVTEDSKINGLELGADIYLTKPFSLRELVTVVKSLFRRVDNFTISKFKSFNNGDLKINFEEQIVLKNDKEIKLTKSEWNILNSLASHCKKIFSRDELIVVALGDDFNGYDRAIDSHIKNLRSKIENDTSNPKYIVTVRGFGYKFGDGYENQTKI